MAARVLFGLGRRHPSLAGFHHAHPRFGTPVRATLAVGAVVLAGALLLPVASLAGMTSTLLLVVFALVNASLVAVKRRAPEAPFRVPMAVPVLGLAAALLALGVSLWGLAA
jgi:amino acid transporter